MAASMQGPLVVLDADGVFMDEMTYWRTALAAAFTLAGFEIGDTPTWERLDRACLHDARLQRTTKSRACNSNWDLAAVMTEALADEATRTAVRRYLTDGRDDHAAAVLGERMERMWSQPIPGQPPISAFGIDRHGPGFRVARQRFQDILYERMDIGWSYPRHELLPPVEETRGALRRLHEAGLIVTVCTSRQRDETEQPIRALGVAPFFDLARMATHDEVRRAQESTGCQPLGKPHWFPLASAALGYEAAVEAVRSNAARLPVNGCPRVVFVGDAAADFDTACGALARGLPVTYVHVDSGISLPETLDAVRSSNITAAIVPDLSAATKLIVERLT